MKKIKLAGALLPALLFGAPAQASSRGVSRSSRRGFKAVSVQKESLHVKELQQEQKKIAHKDPFTLFGANKAHKVSKEENTKDVLSFLQNEGLLSGDSENKSIESGERKERKTFAYQQPYHNSGNTCFDAHYVQIPLSCCTATCGGDTTAPTLSALNSANVTATTADVKATSNEDGTMYYVITTSSTAPTNTQVVAGQDNTGAVAEKSGNSAVTADTEKIFNVTGLSGGTQYYYYFVAKDAADNVSTVYTGWGTFTTPAANSAPTITGASAGQTVDDNATIIPFSGITLADADGDNISLTITLDDNIKGTLSGTGLSGSGPYTLSSDTAANVQAKLRALIFTPTENRIRPNSTEITTFTLSASDGTTTTDNNTTTAVVKGINDSSVITLAQNTISVNEIQAKEFINIASGATFSDADGSVATNANLIIAADGAAHGGLNGKVLDDVRIDTNGTGFSIDFDSSTNENTLYYNSNYVGVIGGGTGLSPLVVKFASDTDNTIVEKILQNLQWRNTANIPLSSRTFDFQMIYNYSGTDYFYKDTTKLDINITSINESPRNRTNTIIGDVDASLVSKEYFANDAWHLDKGPSAFFGNETFAGDTRIKVTASDSASGSHGYFYEAKDATEVSIQLYVPSTDWDNSDGAYAGLYPIGFKDDGTRIAYPVIFVEKDSNTARVDFYDDITGDDYQDFPADAKLDTWMTLSVKLHDGIISFSITGETTSGGTFSLTHDEINADPKSLNKLGLVVGKAAAGQSYSAYFDNLTFNTGDASTSSVWQTHSLDSNQTLTLSDLYVVDHDSNDTLTSELNTTAGTLVENSGSGAQISGSGTGNLSIQGTVAQINSALNGLVFTPLATANGAKTISIKTKDAAGLFDTDTINLSINDIVKPTLSEITAVTTPTNDTTPSYTFSTSEAGTLAVGGSCGSASEGAVTSGNQTITLTQTDNSSALSDGTYSDCTITVTDGAGNASSALSITSFTVDTTAPTTTFAPLNSSTIHPINGAMTITFNEAIRNTNDSEITDTNVDSLITLKETNSSGTDVPFDATISVDKKVITITPTSNLSESQVYYLAYSDVEDNVGNTRTGENISFTAAPDTQVPTISSLSPSNNLTDVALDSNLVITFNENIQKGTGNIELRLDSDDSLVESFDIATSSNIQISNNILTINPTSNLNVNSKYYVTVPNTAIKDVASTPNSFAGILNKGDWDFTTITNAAPTVTGTSAQNINDNSSIFPFANVVLNDANGDNISVTLSLDDNSKGSLSSTSIASDTIANVQTALRAIKFTPARNKLSVGSSETTIVTLSVSDGVLTTNDSNTAITSTSLNDAPSNITPSNSSVKFDSGLNTVVGSLSSNDPDANSNFVYSLVQKGSSTNGLCTSDSNNNLFNISGSNLIVLNPLNMNGTYNVCVQTNDGITTYEKTLPITIVGNSTPVITNIRLLNQSSVAQDEDFNIIAYKNFGTINVEVVASDEDNHNLTYNVNIENQNLFESSSFDNNTLKLISKKDISGNTNITLSVNDGYDTISKTFKVTILSFEDNDDVEKSGDVTIEVDDEGSEVTTVDVPQDNLSVQTKTKTDGTTQHLIDMNGVQTKATSSLTGANVELTENGVQTTYSDSNVDVKIEASVLGESTNSLTTNGQTTSVTSNVIGAQTTLQEDDEGKVEVVVTVSNMQVTIKENGTVSYSIQNDTGSSNVHSNISGGETNITPNGNIETSVGNKADGSSIIKAKSSTTPQGTTVTKFVSVDENGNETELDSTLADNESFANGSDIEIFEQNGVIYIKVTTPLENNLKVK